MSLDWLAASDYWPSRWLFERLLGGIYLIAFLVALDQFPALLGERGLLPAQRYLAVTTWRDAPTLFRPRYSDRLLEVIAWSGITLSALVLTGLPQNSGQGWIPMVVWLLLWILYLSIVNVGQTFYSFGWESLLLECGFLAIFLGPAN